MRGSAAFRTGVAPGGALAPSWVRDALWRNAQAVPSLDLRFADNKSLADATTGANLVSFTRASSGTYVGSNGVLQTATTNLLLRSEEFNDASWTKGNASIITNSIAAPNGTLTGAKLVEDTANATHSARRSTSQTINTSPITFSVYVKAAERAYVGLAIQEATTFTRQANVNFDLANGAANAVSNIGGASASSTTITAVGNGWYRCTLTTTLGGTDANVLSWIYISTSGGFTYTGNGTSGIYLWGAQLEQSSTVGEYIPTTSTINSAPRFDHNPTTGESLGLLVEEQRTNSIRNNTMVGAVAGTPGTLPTNWVFIAGTTGISSQVVESGVVNGINYIDVRYFGTAAATSSFSQRFEGATSIAALTGQTWALSTWTKIQAGSTSGITAINHQYVENTSAGAFVTSSTTAITVDSNFTRHTSTRTLSGGATVAFLAGGISVTVTSGQVIDITLRIGLPQLEQGAFATSVIPTTTATATRSADVASITGTNFSSWYRQDEGSVYWEGTRNRTTGFPERFSLNDGTVNNRIFSYFDAAANSSTFTVVTSSVNQGDIFGGGGALNSNLRTGFGFALNNVSAIYSGGVQNTDTTVTLPIVDRLVIGNGLGGTIRRLTYWPQRLSNLVLQTISGPALPASVVSDPYFSSVSMLLHMNGSNGSTTFTDNSSGARAITANGNAQISTAQSKFGGASGLFDGSGDYLSFSEISIGALTDVTLECWIYLNSVSDVGIFGTLFSGNWQLLAVIAGKLYAYWNGVEVQEPTASITTSTWYHVAITRASGTLRLFVNGTLTATAGSSTSNTTVSRIANTSFRGDLNGYVDDARITVGVARYTSSFTAPTAAFPDN